MVLEKLVSAAFSRPIGALEIGLDLGQGEPGWFEALTGIEGCLIEVVGRLWIVALPKLEHGEGAHLRSKLDYADIGVASRPIPAFVAPGRRSIKIEDHADKLSRATGHGQTCLLIIEWFNRSAGVDALNTGDLAPRHAPGAPGLFEVAEHIFENRDIRRGQVTGQLLRLGKVRV